MILIVLSMFYILFDHPCYPLESLWVGHLHTALAPNDVVHLIIDLYRCSAWAHVLG